MLERSDRGIDYCGEKKREAYDDSREAGVIQSEEAG